MQPGRPKKLKDRKVTYISTERAILDEFRALGVEPSSFFTESALVFLENRENNRIVLVKQIEEEEEKIKDSQIKINVLQKRLADIDNEDAKRNEYIIKEAERQQKIKEYLHKNHTYDLKTRRIRDVDYYQLMKKTKLFTSDDNLEDIMYNFFIEINGDSEKTVNRIKEFLRIR